MEYFGTHPVQICHEDNVPSHSSPYEGRLEVRALTRRELQDFFDHADERVVRIRAAGKKGWAPAFRDATLFKVIYGWGLRRREAANLDLADLSRNPKAPQFGRYGACYVRFGKAVKGSPPRRRTVLTVWEWAAEALAEYVEEVRPCFEVGKRQLLWPTDRGGRVQGREITRRFAEFRDALGLEEVLHPHCLRHSYITHLIEDGHHASDRGRRRSVLCPAAGRPRLGVDDRHLHPCRLGLHEQCPARGLGRRAGRSVMRTIRYRWHLRELMARRGMFNTTDLAPLLAERGIQMSASQVHRLVTGTPERLNLQVFAALCDILDAGPAELFEPVVITSTRRKTAEKTGPFPPASPGEVRRPRRARIVPDQP